MELSKAGNVTTFIALDLERRPLYRGRRRAVRPFRRPGTASFSDGYRSGRTRSATCNHIGRRTVGNVVHVVGVAPSELPKIAPKIGRFAWADIDFKSPAHTATALRGSPFETIVCSSTMAQFPPTCSVLGSDP